MRTLPFILCSLAVLGTAGTAVAQVPSSICGNGIVERGEACDDGNNDDTDRCTNACRFSIGTACENDLSCASVVCRTGFCSVCRSDSECASGLRCDNGSCTVASATCGDGRRDIGEACDDGNRDDDDGCTTLCRFSLEVQCVQSIQCGSRMCSAGQCARCADDTACGSDSICVDGACLREREIALLPNYCGNGIVERGEACDAGAANSNDPSSACYTDCSLPPTAPELIPTDKPTVVAPFDPQATALAEPTHAGAPLPASGPAPLVILAAGAAAGIVYIRRLAKRL